MTLPMHDWFIPNKRNHFHPTILRPLGLGIFVVVLVLIPVLYNAITANQVRVLGYATNITVGDVYALSNQERTKAGLAVLTLDSQLNAAAYAKAQHMLANNYWAHIAPDGTTPWYFMNNAGYSYSAAGENLAMDFNTSNGVVNGWMNSATHKANVLNANYRDVGYAVVDGTLQGGETTLVVAMYATRAAAAAATTKSTPAKAAASTATNTPAKTEQAPVKTEPVVEEQTPIEQPVVTQQSAAQDPVAVEEVPVETGAVEGAITFAPIEAYQGLNWGQKVSIALLSLLLLLFVMKHTIIWRQRRRGVRQVWLRAHPLGQAAVLVIAIVVTLASSTGTVL